MPELPEVETVARGLRQAILGRRIVSVTLGKTDFIDDPVALEAHLPGRRIESVERYGKFMLLHLSPANGIASSSENHDSARASLLVHLGMTGQIIPSPAEQPREKHTHVCLLLDDGRELRYTDARRFGRIAYLTEVPLAQELTRFGADPLEVSQEEFAARVCTRRARIKALLMDQSVLRGVGNIYADESLWRARIHPARLGAQLSAKQAAALREVLKSILKRAIVLRGSSISDFLDAEGEPGEYQRHHRAYGREAVIFVRDASPLRAASCLCLCQKKQRRSKVPTSPGRLLAGREAGVVPRKSVRASAEFVPRVKRILAKPYGSSRVSI